MSIIQSLTSPNEDLKSQLSGFSWTEIILFSESVLLKRLLRNNYKVHYSLLYTGEYDISPRYHRDFVFKAARVTLRQNNTVCINA